MPQPQWPCPQARPQPQVLGLIKVVFIDVWNSLCKFFLGKTEASVITFGPYTTLQSLPPNGASSQTLVSAGDFLDRLQVRSSYQVNMIWTDGQSLNFLADSFCFGENDMPDQFPLM
jgi:hypothetical protein